LYSAYPMVVEGFIEPFIKELPLEYAVELDTFVKLEMEHPPI
jgi:Fe-S cluster assembly scaffold protein SufB